MFLIPFSFVWASIAFAGPASHLSLDGFSPFDLIGILFPLIAIYITVGRFLHDMLVRARTTYAVTDQRVIQLRHFFQPSIRSQDIHSLNAFDLHESRSGRGTISFDYDGDWWSRGGMRWSPAIGRGLRFVAIGQVRDVYALIQGLM